MELNNLTLEQRTELKNQWAAEEAAEKERIQQNREQYKDLVDEFINSNITKLQLLSDQMQALKLDIFADAETLIEMKNELFNTKSNRRSDTFTTQDGTQSISLGNRTYEGWDDTVNHGIAKVKEYLSTLAKDENSSMLVDTVMSLMAKDRKGNLKASKVLELEKMAVKCQNPTFLDGMTIIKAAYRPAPSCQFIEVTLKDNKGNEVKLPLSMAAMK